MMRVNCDCKQVQKMKNTKIINNKKNERMHVSATISTTEISKMPCAYLFMLKCKGLIAATHIKVFSIPHWTAANIGIKSGSKLQKIGICSGYL